MKTSNATDAALAADMLSGMGDDLGEGTVAYIEVRKKGVARGPASNKTIYGDDLVKVLLWTGFHYQSLVERSFKKLHQLWGRGDLYRTLLQAVHDAGHTAATLADISQAVQELDDSFTKGVRGDANGEEGDEPTSVWEPLVVDGVFIPGAKVYVGEGGDDPRSPVKGTIYIDGVKLGEKVVEPSTNGSWLPKQKPKTVAKDILRSWLPVGLYVRYSLERERMLSLKVGAQASAAGKAENIQVDPEAIRSLFKIAP